MNHLKSVLNRSRICVINSCSRNMMKARKWKLIMLCPKFTSPPKQNELSFTNIYRKFVYSKAVQMIIEFGVNNIL